MSSSTSEGEPSGHGVDVDGQITYSNMWLIPAACLIMLTMALVGDAEVWMDTGTPIDVVGLHISNEERRRKPDMKTASEQQSMVETPNGHEDSAATEVAAAVDTPTPCTTA
ncbi:hypothetical protein CLAFUW4_06020 [Fulvia fulva]|uniref:Uncharacterized protein n=1 Tax=Passalora fulva TaxID=5499 RepID=A0A9Q8P9G3_PASFU|nr:uncharacterized protein CLAFUR5_06164 [Fulvia fulva]KAK4624436.1 hypothetical protein CLAFUR4_06025 [Fulvia fulva]KAK4624887.1 hypothetical protein CLAFUR0_06028 [Fulvia fulva]UJO18133.1 hypothetical protein CLAFUR5_06164 [Fulvia fulva]WPV15385.1 hypothetical protein CLAFUW4_06020 [Fulvia fulva]WPV29439.1 hypothetical protein CLAFUW7_06018 [Fulvia fulva]